MALDPRVEAYLNDKLQTFADFEALDALIANVESKQEDLRQQLVEAEHDLQLSHNESAEREAQARRNADEFEKQQADIDRRLTIITNSDTADEAFARFEESLAALRKVEIADQYLALLQEITRLDGETRRDVHLDPDAALAKHADLHALATRLLSLQQSAEGAAPHLVDHVNNAVAGLRAHLRGVFADELKTVLEKILWPKKTVALPMSLMEQFNNAVNRLLTLQKPSLEQNINVTGPADATKSGVLYPLEIMVEPLAARFNYHFSGDRPTNRLDKPEYFLNNFFDMLNTHIDFVNDYIQPLLLQQFRDSKVILNNALYVDATSAFIHALLPMVRRRLFSIVNAVAAQPPFLSHLISELVTFDNTLRNEWRYSPSSTETWRGLTDEVLTQHNLFPRWLQVEKDYALERYNKIINDGSTSTLDFDSTSYSQSPSVPTTAALRLHDLLATVINTYRDLPSFSHRLDFLINIQTDILDQFHSRLHSSLEAYLTMTTSIGRTVQGVSAQDAAELSGVSGLDRLARVYGSAEYLEKAMRDWSDEVFFLDIYAELQRRIRRRSPSEVVRGSLTGSVIAEKTSAKLGDGEEDDIGAGSVFDEPATNYEILRQRAETIITDTLRSSVKESLRPYAKAASFAGTTSGFSAADLATNPNLQGAIRVLSEGLSFLAKALAPAPLRRVARAVATQVDEFIFERVVLGHDFSLQGAAQMTTDTNALLKAMGGALGRKGGPVRLRQTEEALRLLSLPVQREDDEREEEALTLWSVERRLFATNEDARSVLGEMGCASLTEAEARKVLRCRVELESALYGR